MTWVFLVSIKKAVTLSPTLEQVKRIRLLAYEEQMAKKRNMRR